MKPSMKETLKKEKTETVRTAILDAADSIMESEGIDKLSIRKVASLIGYSPGNIYQYFSDKDDLVNNAIMRGYGRLMKSVKAVDSNEYQIPDLIESRFVSYAKAVLEKPIYYKAVMFSDEESILAHTRILDEDAVLERPVFKELIKSIEQGMKEDSIRRGDPVVTAQILWSTIFGILTRGILESEDKDSIIELVKQAIQRAL